MGPCPIKPFPHYGKAAAHTGILQDTGTSVDVFASTMGRLPAGKKALIFGPEVDAIMFGNIQERILNVPAEAQGNEKDGEDRLCCSEAQAILISGSVRPTLKPSADTFLCNFLNRFFPPNRQTNL